MRDARLRGVLRAIGRELRRKPQTHEEAWLSASVVATGLLVSAVIAAALSGWPQVWPIYAVTLFVVNFLLQGLAFSYDVHRRNQL
jgi:uncharacterized membrane protein YoaK (UPF0700 family)